jgi:4'-phosphopantetheinyl transferase
MPHHLWRNGEPLPGSEAHFWYVLPASIEDPDLLRSYHELMTREEVEEHQRFAFTEGRHQYLVTRALVRTVLSRYADVEPRDWSFRPNAYGRPEIAEPAVLPDVRFSLSHTRGCIACLVARQGDVGVDVEDLDSGHDALELANRYFSPREVQDLQASPASLHSRHFLRLWTLKEAYMKARGLGLSLPLDGCSFHVSVDGHIGVSFEPRVNDDARAWQFQLVHPTPRHVAAVAVHRAADGAERAVRIRQTVPLRVELEERT